MGLNFTAYLFRSRVHRWLFSKRYALPGALGMRPGGVQGDTARNGATQAEKRVAGPARAASGGAAKGNTSRAMRPPNVEKGSRGSPFPGGPESRQAHRS